MPRLDAARNADHPSGPSVATCTTSGRICDQRKRKRRVAGNPN
jgi:hypothetical protein